MMRITWLFANYLPDFFKHLKAIYYNYQTFLAKNALHKILIEKYDSGKYFGNCGHGQYCNKTEANNKMKDASSIFLAQPTSKGFLKQGYRSNNFKQF